MLVAASTSGPDLPATATALSVRQGVAALFLSGVFLTAPALLLPLWGWQRQTDYRVMGDVFFATATGLFVAALTGSALWRRAAPGLLPVVLCAVGSATLAVMALVAPPAPAEGRLAGLVLLGLCAGLLQAGAFQWLAGACRHSPRATANLGSVAYAGGALAACGLLAVLHDRLPPHWLTVSLAVVPVPFVFAFRPSLPLSLEKGRAEAVWSAGAFVGLALVALAVMVQLSGEVALAAWLVVFLGQRLALGPAQAAGLLALYWLVLVLGRAITQALLARWHRTRLLAAVTVMVFFGCAFLTTTSSASGAVVGLLLVGAAQAALLPIVLHGLEPRFAAGDSEGYGRIVSLALVGGLMAAGLFGRLAPIAGVRVLMLLPLTATLVLLPLVGLLALEARWAGPLPARAVE